MLTAAAVVGWLRDVDPPGSEGVLVRHDFALVRGRLSGGGRAHPTDVRAAPPARPRRTAGARRPGRPRRPGRLTGPEELSYGTYLFGWLAVHQLGFAWHDARNAAAGTPRAASARADARRRAVDSRPSGGAPTAAAHLPSGRLVFLAGGLGAVLLLTVLGPWPVAMLQVPDERLDNAAPPSLALLAVAAGQLGLILLLRGRRSACCAAPGRGSW